MNKRHKHTVQGRYERIVVLTIIPVIIICIFFTTLAVEQIRNRLASTADTSVRLMAASLTSEMEYEASYMLNNAINNETLRRLGGKVNESQAYLDLYELKLASASLKSSNENLTSYIVASMANNVYMTQYNSSWDGNPIKMLSFIQDEETEMKKLFGSGPIDTENWFPIEISNHTCLARVVRYRLVYQACIIDLDVLVQNVAKVYDAEGTLAIYNTKDELLAGSDHHHLGNIRWNSRGYGTVKYKGENYLAVRENCDNIQFVYYIKDETLRDSFDMIVIMIASVAAIMGTAFFMGWLYLKRTVFTPLDSLVDTMERIKDGDYFLRSDKVYDNEEFKRVNDTFNGMVDKITHLRIDSYEQQLLAERSEMAALKMQIQPHFVLNCLKSVYALTETHRIGEVQTMILLLSKHLRYVLSFTDDTVMLEQELEMCQNYVELLNVGQNRKVTCRNIVDEQIRELRIPNITILTLVENCIKYGRNEESALQITITAKYLNINNEGLANITVSDNGVGFSEEQLISLNKQVPAEKDGYHVGIGNVYRRMQLCFGPEAAIAFSNAKTGGAIIDLYLSTSINRNVITDVEKRFDTDHDVKTDLVVDNDTNELEISDEEFWKDMQDE